MPSALHEFPSDLSWKIFLDRYTQKDPTRAFVVGDLAIAVIEPDPKWPKKDIGRVLAVEGETLTLELLTGPQTGETITRSRTDCDRPVESTLAAVAQRIGQGIARVESPDRQAATAQQFADEITALRWIPGGRIWAGAGTNQQLTYFNCLARETRVHTKEGIKAIGALKGPVEILTEDGRYRTAIFGSYGIQPLYRVTLENGDHIDATAGHEWVVAKSDGHREILTTLFLKDHRIPIQPPSKPAVDPEGVAHGIVFGDGTLDTTHRRAVLELIGHKQDLLVWVQPYARSVTPRANSQYLYGLPKNWKTLPSNEATPAYWRGFIIGLIATDGCVDTRGSVIITQNQGAVLQAIERHASEAGFFSLPIRCLRKVSNLGSQYAPCLGLGLIRASISENDLILPKHRDRFLSRKTRATTIRVVSVTPTHRTEEVFCCNEPETHTMVIERGYLTRQCYVLPNPQDSREGIVETLGQMIEIMSRGGGVGINVSSLRPTHALVRGVNGRSSGAVSWMDLYSRATALVEQGGSRRGALMLQLEDWHPDLPKFIAVKQTPGMVENANISVRVSDDFMAAVKADRDWDLVFPDTQDPDYDTLWDGNLETWKAAGKPVIVYETVKARELWQQLIAGAWAAAEPGIVFDQRHESESNSWYFNPLVCTNPCVTGETRVATNAGLVPIRELAQGASTPDLILDSRRSQYNSQAPLVSAWFTGIRPVITLTTREGYHIRCTPDHRIRTTNGWCPADQLTPGTEILLLNRGGAFGKQGSEDLGRTLGWLIGDGTIKSDSAVLSFFHEKQSLADTMAHSVNRLIRPAVNHRDYVVHPVAVGQTEQRVSSTRFREIADQHGLIPNKLQVPEIIFRSTESCQRAFLQALFSADGTVSHHVKKSRTVRLTSISRPLLEQVQQLLLNFQIVSRIYDNRRSGRTTSQLPDGHGGHRVYPVKPLYELEVSKDNLQRFQQRIGFLLDSKQATLQTVLASYVHGPQTETFTAHVASVVPDGTEAVYDLTESVTHSFSANGLIIANCAEQPLPAWGVCTLGHVNLAKFVDPLHHDIDWDALKTTVEVGIRFLDDVVDATPYFYEENRANQQRERRIGLGTLGLGELLIRLGYRYGSPESLAFIDRLFRFIAETAYRYDTELAKEKGSFPAFDAEKLLHSWFMQRMPDSVREAIRQHGLRNVTLLTQAPTGSVGTMIGTSTGIEPFYALTYFRQSRLGFDQQYVDVAREWLDAHPGEDLPDFFVGAMDLTPDEHVHVQAAIQAWTDSSISKTANAPSTYTVEDTARLYELAYDLGCKGVTIYRDQSRQEQVLHLSSADTPDPETSAPADAAPPAPSGPAILPVPGTISGTTYRKETPAGTARVVVNTENGEPFEVFLLLGRAGSEVQSFMEALGRIISLHLRTQDHVPAKERLHHIADQLRGIGGANQMGFGPHRVLSVVDAIGQVLQQAESPTDSVVVETASDAHPVAPSTSVPSHPTYDLCPQCNAPTLVYEEGCLHCINPDGCGWSRC